MKSKLRGRCQTALRIGVFITLFGLTGCVIDRSILVAPGEERGAIRVIDGNLEIARGGRVASVRAIDGDILLQPESLIGGRVRITDGKLSAQKGAKIGGSLVAHHATLNLDGARIEGDVEIFCTGGTITNTEILTELRVRKKALWHVRCDVQNRLEIGPGTTISKLTIESAETDVIISEEANVGEISGKT